MSETLQPDQKTLEPNQQTDDKSADSQIPEKYQGLPSEVVEELMQDGPEYIDPDVKQSEATRKSHILEAVRAQENARESQKTAMFTEQYKKMTDDQRKEFPQHQQESQQKITGMIQGTLELAGLSTEEDFVIRKLQRQYQEFVREHPGEPYNVELQSEIDKTVFNNLGYRLAFEDKATDQRVDELNEANEIRKQIGIPEQPIADNPEIQQPQQEAEKTIDDYMQLPNVEAAYNHLLNKLQNSGIISAGALKPYLYEMLVTRSAYQEQKQKLPELADKADEYRNKLSSLQSSLMQTNMDVTIDPRMMGNPGWFHIVTRPESKGKIPGNSQKRYATIETSNPNYIDGIDQLASNLKSIAEQNDDSIELKFPESFESFIQHNDTLVIHFKKPESAEMIDEALGGYLSGKGINEGERELGRTKFAEDSQGTSFSDNVAMEVARWGDQNFGKYPNETIAKTMIYNVIKLSQAA